MILVVHVTYMYSWYYNKPTYLFSVHFECVYTKYQFNSVFVFRPLQQLFQEEAKRILEEQSEGEAGALRKRHNVLSQQVQELWNRARLIEKGIQKMDEG